MRGVQQAKQLRECVAWHCLQTRKEKSKDADVEEQEEDAAEVGADGKVLARRCRVRYPKDEGEAVRLVVEASDDWSFGVR